MSWILNHEVLAYMLIFKTVHIYSTISFFRQLPIKKPLATTISSPLRCKDWILIPSDFITEVLGVKIFYDIHSSQLSASVKYFDVTSLLSWVINAVGEDSSGNQAYCILLAFSQCQFFTFWIQNIIYCHLHLLQLMILSFLHTLWQAFSFGFIRPSYSTLSTHIIVCLYAHFNLYGSCGIVVHTSTYVPFCDILFAPLFYQTADPINDPIFLFARTPKTVQCHE